MTLFCAARILRLPAACPEPMHQRSPRYVVLGSDTRGTSWRSILALPNPVNDHAARVTAALVVLLRLIILLTGWSAGLWLLAAGFVVRALFGPRVSPFALLSLAAATAAIAGFAGLAGILLVLLLTAAIVEAFWVSAWAAPCSDSCSGAGSSPNLCAWPAPGPPPGIRPEPATAGDQDAGVETTSAKADATKTTAAASSLSSASIQSSGNPGRP